MHPWKLISAWVLFLIPSTTHLKTSSLSSPFKQRLWALVSFRKETVGNLFMILTSLHQIPHARNPRFLPCLPVPCICRTNKGRLTAILSRSRRDRSPQILTPMLVVWAMPLLLLTVSATLWTLAAFQILCLGSHRPRRKRTKAFARPLITSILLRQWIFRFQLLSKLPMLVQLLQPRSCPQLQPAAIVPLPASISTLRPLTSKPPDGWMGHQVSILLLALRKSPCMLMYLNFHWQWVIQLSRRAEWCMRKQK